MTSQVELGGRTHLPVGDVRDGFDPWVRNLPYRGTAIYTSVLVWESMDRGAWWAVVHRVTKSRTRLI